jgi:hypothetical protein
MATTTTLTSSASPVTYGQAVTLTATLSPTTATGKVTFYDGTTVLGTATLTTAVAQLTTSLLASGARHLKAYYEGDSGDAASLSTALTQTISPVAGNGFQAPSSLTTGDFPYAVAVGDFNNDGVPDFVVANYNSNTVSVFLSASGSWAAAANYTVRTSPSSVAVADFNGDGFPDLAVTNAGDGSVSILLGVGDGTFGTEVHYATGGTPLWVAVGDFNGDGFPDLAVANSAGTTISILLGAGDGTFGAQVPYTVGSNPMGIAVGDFNGDGIPDLAVANNGDGTVSILGGVGDGTFSTAVGYSSGTNPRSVAAGDFNGDGHTDLAVVNQGDGTVSILLNSGTGTFAAAVPYSLGSDATFLALADFNGDGFLDIATSSTDSIGVLTGVGNGTFSAAASYDATSPLGIVAADFNGDGVADVATTDSVSSLQIFLGSVATTTTLISSANPSISGASVTFTATISNLAATGTVTFEDASNSNAVLGSGAVTLVSGVATLPISTLSAGTHSIIAVYSGDSTYAGSTSTGVIQNVLTATTTGLVSSLNPSTFGGSVTFTATISNLAATGTVTFEDASNGDAVLGSGAATLSSGIASVSVSSLALGNHFIAAVYSGDATYGGSTSTFVTQNVVTATTTGLVSSLNPSTVGVPVTFTATVSNSAATGTITFEDASNANAVLGSGAVTVISGGAQLALSSLSAGVHSIIAVYSGDSTYAGSTSSGVSQNVTLSTTTVLTSSASPVTYGHTVTLTATLSPTSATGKVTFYDGTTVLGTSTLASGIAQFTTTLLASGVRSLKAYYEGDSNRSPGISAAFSQTIAPVAGAGFQTTIDLNTGSAPWGVAVGDFNSDGIPDFAVTNKTDGTVSVFLGISGGTFHAAATYTVGSNPVSVAVGDFNGDGNPDLAVANLGDGTVSILLGSSNGVFTVFGTPIPVNTPTSIAVADFNADGFPDLAVVNHQNDEVSILFGAGDGTFGAPAPYVTGNGPNSVVVADFNQDGLPDLAVTNLADNTVSVLLGDGAGTFDSPLAYTTGSGPVYVAAADFNGDGYPDLVVVNSVDGTVSVIINEEIGTFAAAVPYTVGAGPVAVALADFNGDGFVDLAVSSSTSISELLGTGTGTFFAATSVGTDSTAGIVVADVNGDGIADLAAANVTSGNTLDVFIGLGVTAATTTTVTSSLNPSTSGSSVTLTATVLPSSATGTITFFDDGVQLGSPVAMTLNAATYTSSAFSLGAHPITAVYSGDVNNGVSTSPTLTQNVLTATTTGLVSSLNPSIFGASVTFTATISNLAATGTVTFEDASNGNAVLGSGPATVSSGIAALAVSSLSLGTHSIVAVYSGDSTYAGNSSSGLVQQVLTASTTTLISSLNPSTSGGSVTFTATISNSAATGTVTFEDASNGGAVLGLGPVTLMSGIASVSVSSLSVGTHLIVAVYNGDSTYEGSTSSAVSQNVTLGTATVLTSSASPVTYGHTVTLTATLAPTSATGKVTFYDGTTVLGTATLATGVAQFTTTLLASGVRSLKAHYEGDGSDAAGNSNVLSQTVSPVAGNGFGAPASLTTGNSPWGVALGDFNGDGVPDFAVANQSDNSVGVFLSASGTWTAAANYNVGAMPVWVAVGDFNGDGHPDLAVLNQNDNTVSILLGGSNGTFGAAVPYAVGSLASLLVVGDFNGDGFPDLAVTNQSDNTVSILLGVGDGTFNTQTTYPTGNAPISLAVGDFNGDGSPDLAVVNNAGSNVSVLLGAGDGTFAVPVNYATEFLPIGVAVGDFNRDGHPDLAVIGLGGQVSILLNTGTGTFSPQVPYTIGGGYAYYVASGDFNGDGFLDLAVTTTDSTRVLLGAGDGSFAAGVGYGAGYTAGIAVADFNGDGIADIAAANQTSGNTLDIFLGLAATGTTVISSANPSIFGASITLTATISNSSATGTVTFEDASNSNAVLGSGPVTVSSGVAILSLSSLTAGTHSIVAVYSGDSTNAASTSSALAQNVLAATTTALTSSLNPSTVGAGVTFTAVISDLAATGTVTFEDASNGNAVLGSGPVPVSGGIALLAVSSLSAGTHSIVAVYSGDSNNGGSTSSAVSQHVLTATTTTLISSLNPSTSGTSVTFTATISTSAATGTVIFEDASNGDAALGSGPVALSGGIATLAVSSLSIGTHLIIAVYSGDSAYTGSTSSAVSQSVVAKGTTLISSLNPSTFGAGVTLTASVVPSSATGTVTFKDGSATLGAGPVTLSGGVAALFLTTLSVGDHTLTAVYSGDSNNLPTTSAVLTQTVNAITTVTALTTPTNPAVYGQAVGLTATVSPSTATGSVIFKDGSVVLFTEALVNGVANVAVQSLASGMHALTAVYSGDANDAASTGALSLDVDNCGTSTESSLFADSTGGPQIVTVTSTAPNCAWNASTSSGWIELSGSGGVGTGSVTATLAANATGVVRTGTILVGGQSIAVTQRVTAQIFADVLPPSPYFDAANMLYAQHITSGCSADPLDYCPDVNIPRWEMAVFIVRSVFGGDNFTAPTIPIFNDVPPGSPGFAWIQEMSVLGITEGCGVGDFCPNEIVPRDQMAVFVIRMRYGSTAIFDFPTTPYFTDVTPDTFGWSWIQRLKEDAITNGCTATTFCPTEDVTRGEMAVFIMAGGFNALLPPGTPVIASISPATITHGSSGTFTITGLNTNFVQGTTTVSPIPGVMIGAITVNSATSLTVQLTAASDAILQPVSIQAITDTEEAVLPNSLIIQ